MFRIDHTVYESLGDSAKWCTEAEYVCSLASFFSGRHEGVEEGNKRSITPSAWELLHGNIRNKLLNNSQLLNKYDINVESFVMNSLYEYNPTK